MISAPPQLEKQQLLHPWRPMRSSRQRQVCIILLCRVLASNYKLSWWLCGFSCPQGLHPIAGAAGGVVALLATYPLMTVCPSPFPSASGMRVCPPHHYYHCPPRDCTPSTHPSSPSITLALLGRSLDLTRRRHPFPVREGWHIIGQQARAPGSDTHPCLSPLSKVSERYQSKATRNGDCGTTQNLASCAANALHRIHVDPTGQRNTPWKTL